MDLGLLYLARHQDADGSWGRLPAKCRCSPPPGSLPPVSSGESKRYHELLDRLDGESIEEREQAQHELTAAGPAALGAIHARYGTCGMEFDLRCRRIIGEIDRRPEISGDVEITALAVLSFLGAGYSHLSRELRGGFVYGDVVRSALRWLLARQREDGSFDDRDMPHAVASLAIIEAQRLTQSRLFEDAAIRAHEAMARRIARTSRDLFWKALVYRRAPPSSLSRHWIPETVAGTDASSWAVAVLMETRGMEFPSEPADPESYFVATLGLFVLEGPTGEHWKRWGAALRDRLVKGTPSGCRAGSWTGSSFRARLRNTAFNTLSAEVYYRYANVLAAGN